MKEYSMNDDDFDRLGDFIKAYTKDDYGWSDMIEAAEPRQKYDHASMLREVMHELHKQGGGQDTLLALKNDQLRDWWAAELSKIKKAEAKAAAIDRAKSLLSEEERKLLGMKF